MKPVGYFRRARINCWVAVCLCVLEGRPMTLLRKEQCTPQLSLF